MVINQRSLVAIVSGNQDAVSIMTLDSNAAGAEESVNEYLNQEGITTVGKSNANRSGLIAFHAEATGQSENGIQLKFYLYAIEYDGAIYRFLNYTTIEKYGSYRPQFIEIANGFRELTELGFLNIQPVRLQTVKATRSGTFQSYIPANLESLPIAISVQDLAIMNQVEVDELINVGTWLKLPS